MPLTEKQKQEKRKRYKNATEAEYIAAIFERHGVTPAQVIRGAAAALLDGEPIRTEREPLTIPEAEAGQGASDPIPEAPDADGQSPFEE